MQNGIYVPVLASARGLVTQVKREAEKAGQAGGKAMAAKFGAAGRAAGEAAAAGISASSRNMSLDYMRIKIYPEWNVNKDVVCNEPR